MWERSATWEATMFMRTSLSGEIFPSFYPFAHGVRSLGCDVCLSVTNVNTQIEDLVEHLTGVTLTDENTNSIQLMMLLGKSQAIGWRTKFHLFNLF